VVISALVHYQEGDPGRGFYDMAERKGLIPRGLNVSNRALNPARSSPVRLSPSAAPARVASAA
jgi:hypothetical protein